ncbi:MAG: hypothetical protein C0599_06950 [Salinivirgaceae bacterium]|nr:MAG: hypothetical protein C0599_06950 [Salinivirgaceae bacterium]
MKRFYAVIIGLSFALVSFGQYETIDTYVKTITFKKSDGIPEIAAKITAKSNTDKEKLRAIFAWIAHNIEYDVRSFMTGRIPKSEPMDVVQSGKGVCQGYANLFEAMSQAVGIEAYVVSGFSKGYGYSDRKRLDNSDHAWNAVNLSGEWYLLDPTWGAGHLNEKGKYVSSMQEKYFLAKPAFFVTEHLPEDPAFQMLPCPITPEEFLKDSTEVFKIAKNKKACYSYVDTLNSYSKLDSVLQKVATAMRMYRYYPENTYMPAILINQAAYHYSVNLNDTKLDLKTKMELARKSLKYYQMAENIIKKNRKPEGRQLYDMVKKNISNVERFIDFYKDK